MKLNGMKEVKVEFTEQYFGFNDEKLSIAAVLPNEEDQLCCVITCPDFETTLHLRKKFSLPRQLVVQGRWLLSGHIGKSVKFSGPFVTLEEAMDAARVKFGAVRFLSAPEFI